MVGTRSTACPFSGLLGTRWNASLPGAARSASAPYQDFWRAQFGGRCRPRAPLQADTHNEERYDRMKIQDIPQTGKLGLTVTWSGRNGLLRRILVTPKNPRTDRQLVVRDLLVQQARRFDALTDAQQDAWNVAAAGFHSTPSLGQSGPLTGLQLFVRINCKL